MPMIMTGSIHQHVKIVNCLDSSPLVLCKCKYHSYNRVESLSSQIIKITFSIDGKMDPIAEMIALMDLKESLGGHPPCR